MKSSFLNDYFYHNPNTFNRSTHVKSEPRVQDNYVHDTTKSFETKSQQTSKNSDLRLVCAYNDCTFENDPFNQVILIRWIGKVNVSTTKRLLLTVISSEEFSKSSKIILDQSKLIEFDTEARLWLKSFLSHNASKFNSKILKLASIRPATMSGIIFSNFASEIIKSEMPSLKLKRFDQLEEALTWINN